MAKPKKPLLSLGARGTIADTLTFQKRGQLTIARRKPIPKDPKSDAQLAQRQIYREAVDAWNALSPQEKQAWRGVCPALTPFQCFMRYKIDELLHPPTPEEYTEEQTAYDIYQHMYSGNFTRQGQRLTIADRKVTKLGFWLEKAGLPTGDITFTIRKVSDNSILASGVYGDASLLETWATYREAIIDTPVTVNEEVRILVEWGGGDVDNRLEFHYKDSDIKPEEFRTEYFGTTWYDRPAEDAAYRYKYYLP